MKIKLLLISGVLLFNLPASANSLFQSVELTDAELAQLRGRYTLPDRIISFGVTMSSTWQNSAGQVIGAAVNLEVTRGHLQPTLSITPIDQAGNGQLYSGAKGQVIGGAGLGSVQGLSQSVRVAGDFNRGLNDLAIEFGAATPNSQQAAHVDWANGQSFGNAVGTVTLSARDGGLRLAVQAHDNQGFALQQIGGKGITQQAHIAGTLNEVLNRTALRVALDDTASGLQWATSAWEQLRPLHPTGY